MKTLVFHQQLFSGSVHRKYPKATADTAASSWNPARINFLIHWH